MSKLESASNGSPSDQVGREALPGRRYDWLFLDAGETLFQLTSPAAAFGSALARFGLEIQPEHLARVVERARIDSMAPDHIGGAPHYAISAERAEVRRRRLVDAILRGMGVEESKVEAGRDVVRQAFVTPDFFGIYPEVSGVIERLRRAGYRLGVISNWEPRLPLLCENHGLANQFDFILASEAEGFAKPGPHLFRRALELAQVSPERAVHIGDSYELDVLAARGVGLGAILLDRGGYYPPGTWQPTIRSLSELPNVLRR